MSDPLFTTVSVELSEEEFFKLRDVSYEEAMEFLASKNIKLYSGGYDHLKIICHRTGADGLVHSVFRQPLFFAKKQKSLEEKIKYAEEQIPILVKDARIPEARQLIDEISPGLSERLDPWRTVLAPPVARVVRKLNKNEGCIDEDDGYPD